MPSASHSATANVSADTVWNILVDLQSWSRWLRVPYASESVTVVSGASTEVGTEFTLKGRLRFRLFGRITELEEMRLLAFDIVRSEYPSDRLLLKRARIALELGKVNERQTRVTCTHWVEGKGLLGRLYMATAFRPFLVSNVRSVARSLAQSAQSTGDLAR